MNVTRTKVVQQDYFLWNVSTSYSLSLEGNMQTVAQNRGHKGAGVFEIFPAWGLSKFLVVGANNNAISYLDVPGT